MRKIITFIFACIAFSILFNACKTETYADKLKKEDKSINRFLSDNHISVLNKYPASGVFAENEYFKEPTTGVYIHVIDSGNKDKPTKGRTVVYLRYQNIINLQSGDTLSASNNTQWSDLYYMSFGYGDPDTYYNPYTNTTKDYHEYMFLSQACVVPLDYGLGNNAKIKLIVPFSSGSAMQQSNYITLFYTTLTYRFINDDLED